MTVMRKRPWKSKRRRLAELSWRDRALLAEAAAGLVTARARLLVFPFRKLAGRFGTFVPAKDPRAAAFREPGPPADAELARKVGWAVTRAAVHVPFRAVCLPQAMTAHAMLRRRGVASALHFGARRGGEKPLDAHAWLDAAGVEVTGYPIEATMIEIGCFV